VKTPTNDIVGKTIAFAKFNGAHLLLSFTDDTLAVISGRCYYDSDIELCFNEFDWKDWESWLVEMDICSQEELTDLKSKDQAKNERWERKRKLEQFYALKEQLGL
jgi:hypothetical protein